MEDFNRRDTGRVCELFAPDLIADYQDGPRKTYDSLCAGLRESLADLSRSSRYSLGLEEILVSGDLAVVRLVWPLEVEPEDGSAAVVERERGLDVFRRQDGTWKIIRFLALLDVARRRPEVSRDPDQVTL
jgi:ketosteroid isomerase-like protein